MFIKSAAIDTLQGKAIQAVNEKWGEDFRKWGGHETIGIPVCKKKYSPFSFSIIRHEVEREDSESHDEKSDSDSKQVTKRRRPRLEVIVKRRYGCKCHSDIRKAVIEQHGVRNGWEPFGQWSMKKALELARRETERLNQPRVDNTGSRDSCTEGTTSEDWTSSDDERVSNNSLPSMCNNGSCTWKVKAKYDNIFREIHGRSESDEE